jgi:iron complex transport system permease protein
MDTKKSSDAPETGVPLRLLPLAAAALVLLLLAGVALSLLVGDVKIDARTVGNALFHYDAASVPQILIHDGRLPRALADVLVGAALAVAGAIMQAVTRNPLASPGVMGLNTGASFAVVLTLALAPAANRPELMLASIGGAAMGVVLVYGVASLSRGGMTPVRLALTGVAVSALLGAIGNGVMIYFELGQDALLWHARGTDGVQWPDLAMYAPLAAVGLLMASTLAPSLGVLSLGEQVARGLGQRTRRAKILAATTVLILVGGAVSVAGPVGFIGLMIPHVVRHLVGHNYRLVIPGAALGGAILMLAADVVARLATTPMKTPVPVGVVTALLGVPFFLYLACRRPATSQARGGRL